MTSEYGAYALRAGLARLYAGVRMNTPTRKHAHTDECVILIAFPLQQWFRERASLLRYTYIACIVKIVLRSFFAFPGKGLKDVLSFKISPREM